MEEQLISKKDLLEQTGITYGQLYRWKRKQLIPEEWFIKKSSYTGQETYFPKARVLERIEKIINMKEELSLDALAEAFSPTPGDLMLSREALMVHPLFNKDILELFKDHFELTINFQELAALLIAQDHLVSGEITLEEGIRLMNFLKQALPELPEKAYDLVLVRKIGSGFWLLLETQNIWMMEQDVKIVIQKPLQKYIEILKTKL